MTEGTRTREPPREDRSSGQTGPTVNVEQAGHEAQDGARSAEPQRARPLPALPENAAAARAHVVALLHSGFCEIDETTIDDVVLADVLLVTSELVTNALRHGGGITDFAAELADDGLRIMVADASDQPPVTVTHRPGEHTAGGYGWLLVCRLAKSVAVTVTGSGKRIEAFLRLS